MPEQRGGTATPCDAGCVEARACVAVCWRPADPRRATAAGRTACGGEAFMSDERTGDVLPFVLTEVRSEIARLGLAKEDFDRCGVSLDDLNREVLRRFMERGQGSIAGIVDEILAQLHLN